MLKPSRILVSAIRQALIREIRDHVEETYFLSSRALAKRFELDPTTIFHTVAALGYKRYGGIRSLLTITFCDEDYPCALMKSAVRDTRSVESHIEHTKEPFVLFSIAGTYGG